MSEFLRRGSAPDQTLLYLCTLTSEYLNIGRVRSRKQRVFSRMSFPRSWVAMKRAPCPQRSLALGPLACCQGLSPCYQAKPGARQTDILVLGFSHLPLIYRDTNIFQGVLCKQSFYFLILFIYLFIYLFIFWLCWVFVSARGLSLVAASGGHSSSRRAGLSLSQPLLLRSTGSRRAGSVVVAHGPSCSAACGIFSDQGSNPCPLH